MSASRKRPLEIDWWDNADQLAEWINSLLIDQGVHHRTLLVHPLDENRDQQQRLARAIRADLTSFDASPSVKHHICCTIWHGLDRAVEDDEPFADEQSLGFALASLIDRLATNGLIVFRFRQRSLITDEEPLERVLHWVYAFGLVDVRYREQNGSWQFTGRKGDPRLGAGPLKVGALLSERKIKKILTPTFNDRAKEMGVTFEPQNKSVDVVLFKSDPDTPIPNAWTRAVIVDSPANVKVLNDRLLTNELAKSVLASPNDPLDVCLPSCSVNGLEVTSFPILAKPNDASAHGDLWFIDSQESLALLPSLVGNDRRWFFQQCIDHGSVLFKVSVLGKDVSMARRPSAVPTLEGPMRKLARTGDEHPRKTGKKPLVTETPQALSIKTPPFRLVVEVAKRLQSRFGLQLFGFDLIVELGTSRTYLVDVNYFPSFVDVPGKERLLFRTLYEAHRHMSSGVKADS